MTPEFDRLAPEYEALLHDPIREAFAGSADFFVTRKVDLLAAFAGQLDVDRRHATWTDVGCGMGHLLRAAGGMFGAARGCDVSSGMLDACRDLNVVQQDDPLRLPYVAGTTDWVTAVCLFHHIAPVDRRALAADMWRVLRPGGLCVVMEHNPLNPAVQIIVRRTPVDADARLLTSGRTRRLLVSAGFEILDTRYFLLMPRRLYRRWSGIEAALSRLPFGGQYAVLARRPRG